MASLQNVVYMFACNVLNPSTEHTLHSSPRVCLVDLTKKLQDATGLTTWVDVKPTDYSENMTLGPNQQASNVWLPYGICSSSYAKIKQYFRHTFT